MDPSILLAACLALIRVVLPLRSIKTRRRAAERKGVTLLLDEQSSGGRRGAARLHGRRRILRPENVATVCKCDTPRNTTIVRRRCAG